MVDIPRISFDNLPQELKAELNSKVRRLGYLGEFFQVCAHQPVALGHFIRFTETLKDALPINLVELCALTISTWSENAYERVQHESLALKLGMTKGWVHDVQRLEPDSAAQLNEIEKAVQRLALAMAKTQGRHAGRELAELSKLGNPQLLTGILLTVVRYIAHSTICNALKLVPPVMSPMVSQP